VSERQLGILDAQGQPIRTATTEACPRCGAAPDTRVPSAGFGTPHPVCPCGFEWLDEVWRG
jgi:hypothetical protein